MSSSDFGRQFSTTVDGQVCAQPLVVGKTVVAATGNAKVYWRDSASGKANWTRNLGGPEPPPVTVMVAATETLGQVLTDPDGRTLYRYDVERTETIGCVDPRTDTRKPLLDPPGAALRPAPGLAGTLGTVTRSDGGDQVTYDGSPLYRSTADHRPADTNGVDLHWHVINPQKAPEPAATTR